MIYGLKIRIKNIIKDTMEESFNMMKSKPKHIYLPEEDAEEQDVPCYGKCMDIWGECCGCLRTWIPCIFCCCVDYPYKIVNQSYEGVYEKFGRYLRTVKPGLHYINPFTETLSFISTKIKVLDLSRQVTYP